MQSLDLCIKLQPCIREKSEMLIKVVRADVDKFKGDKMNNKVWSFAKDIF